MFSPGPEVMITVALALPPPLQVESTTTVQFSFITPLEFDATIPVRYLLALPLKQLVAQSAWGNYCQGSPAV
jgi:hypothetical protein